MLTSMDWKNLRLSFLSTCKAPGQCVITLDIIAQKLIGLYRIMHVVTCKTCVYLQSLFSHAYTTVLRRPHNSLATIGLRQCIDALKGMEVAVNLQE